MNEWNEWQYYFLVLRSQPRMLDSLEEASCSLCRGFQVTEEMVCSSPMDSCEDTDAVFEELRFHILMLLASVLKMEFLSPPSGFHITLSSVYKVK